MKKYFVMLVLTCIFILSLVGCNKDIEKLSIYKMKNFSAVQKDSMITITDSEIVTDILKGFSKAKKETGIVNMVDPQYKVELENETIFFGLMKNTEQS